MTLETPWKRLLRVLVVSQKLSALAVDALPRFTPPLAVVTLFLQVQLHRNIQAVARLTGYRCIPGDPVLKDRRAEPARREAWLRDPYQHIEEHRHTLREVQTWFRDNGVVYLRAFPSALLDGESDDLFAQSEDDWPIERLVAQLSWMRTLGSEGGVFAAIGCRPA